MNNDNGNALFSSKTENWHTPKDLFNELDKEFSFDCDPCTTKENPLGCRFFYTKEQDGLKQVWFKSNFINPPYGPEIGKWLERAHKHAEYLESTSVFLLPARTDTKWFHQYCYGKPNVELRFLKGRVKFIGVEQSGYKRNSAPFPSMLVIIRPQIKLEDVITEEQAQQISEELAKIKPGDRVCSTESNTNL